MLIIYTISLIILLCPPPLLIFFFGNLILMLGKGEGIVIAPHVAGHLLGGTVWKITKDGEDVIYAVDLNHRKER
jgi:hypothetical protein